jgi:hypothetical protein
VRLDLPCYGTADRLFVIAQTVICIGWLVLVIAAGMAHAPVHIGALTACYGLAMIIASTVAGIRNRSPRGRTTLGP